MKYLFFLVFFVSLISAVNASQDYDESCGPLRIECSSVFIQWARTQGISCLTLKLQRFDYGDAEFVNSDIISIPIKFDNTNDAIPSLTKLLDMFTFNAFNLDIVRTGSWIIPWDFDPKTNTISPLTRHQYYEAK